MPGDRPVHEPAGRRSDRWRWRLSAVLSWLRRRWLLLLVILAFVLFVILNAGELEGLARALIRAQWGWIVAALVAQTAYYVLYTVQYKYAFATVEVASEVGELLPVMFASIFLRTIVPSGGVSGAAVFIDDAVRRGQSGARTAEGAVLVLALDLATLLPLLLIGIAYLSRQGTLAAYQVLGAAIYLAFCASLAAALFLGRLAPATLHKLLRLLQGGVNGLARRLGRPQPLPPGWAEANATDLSRAAGDVASHRRELRRTAGVAGAAQVINLFTVAFVGRAYLEPLTAGTVVAAFSMQALFSVVTVIPNGLVVAEAVMVAVLTSLAVPTAPAIIITVVYRGLSVWLPLLVGFLFLRYVRTFGGPGRLGGGEREGQT